jgi:hypothetical protein
MTGSTFMAAAALLAFLSLGSSALVAQTAPPAARSARSVETSLGADGVAVALFIAPSDGRLSVGARAGLGFEWADFRMNDPAVALAARWSFLESRRWVWWVGAEAGAACIDTDYDRFVLPFAGAFTGGRFRFRESVAAFLEAGGRFGRRDLEREASLDFLDARYEETVFIDPLVLRLGLALSF